MYSKLTITDVASSPSTGPLAAALVNRWGMLTVATTGSLLVCSSIFLSSMITNFSGFVAVYGFICGKLETFRLFCFGLKKQVVFN